MNFFFSVGLGFFCFSSKKHGRNRSKLGKAASMVGHENSVGPAENKPRRRGAALRGRAARDAAYAALPNPNDAEVLAPGGSVLRNLGMQNDSAEARRGHALGRTVCGAAGLGLLVFLLVSEGFAGNYFSKVICIMNLYGEMYYDTEF
jgi:hypothetical protein